MGQAHKLKPLQINKPLAKGMYGDGGGLWLSVGRGGGKAWVHRYMIAGKARNMGLGPYPDTSIAEARDKAAENRRKIRSGIDPLDEKREAKTVLRAARAKSVSFDWCASQFIDAHKAGWRNAKHADQWRNTLQAYVSPIMGSLAIDQVDTAHVMKALQLNSLWTQKPQTASRVRGRIEAVLDWATARKYRTGENPARWKGHLDTLLPARSKVRAVKHHAALPWSEMAGFMAALREQNGVAALALEFAIMTAARSGEVRSMTWSEVDLEACVWIVPGTRMKAGKDHRVPLSDRAKEILQIAKDFNKELVFPGSRDNKPLSDMSLTAVLRRMDRGELTAHGFRSSFRDWAAETTNYPSEMAEMALAHTVSNKVEAAYRRGDMFQKRLAMMEDWAQHCGCQ